MVNIRSIKFQISSLDLLLMSQNVPLRFAVNTYQSAQKIIRIKHIHLELSRGGLIPSQSLREYVVPSIFNHSMMKVKVLFEEKKAYFND